MNYKRISNKKLVKKQDKLFELFTTILNDEEVELLNELCEMERELTLRETN